MKKIIALLTAIAISSILTLNASAIDFNTATADELANDKDLVRMGPVTAKKVVADRDINGKFVDTADLTRVSGIGARFIELNTKSIEFGDKVADKAPAKKE